MAWKLFIDDIRDPIDNTWSIARSSNEAKSLVLMYGIPTEISFDHDLGGDDTAFDFIYWMENEIVFDGRKFPDNFKFSVHSSNPVGKENIEKEMNFFIQYMKYDYVRKTNSKVCIE